MQTYTLSFFGISDRGLRRSNNEDHFTVADLTRQVLGAYGNQVTPTLLRHVIGPRGTLLAVADGLGGYEGGELASRMAIEITVQTLFTDHIQTLPLQNQLVVAIEAAHQAICQHRHGTTDYPYMASTLTTVHIGQGTLTIAHVGDSRAYRLHNGILELLTEDQTVVNMMQKEGVLTDEEADQHPHKHLLLQALGQDTPISPSLQSYPFQDGDLLLLCTDGLSSYVPHETIHRIIASEHDVHARCRGLIEAAYDTGAQDNVTVLLARLSVDCNDMPHTTS